MPAAERQRETGRIGRIAHAERRPTWDRASSGRAQMSVAGENGREKLGAALRGVQTDPAVFLFTFGPASEAIPGAVCRESGPHGCASRQG